MSCFNKTNLSLPLTLALVLGLISLARADPDARGGTNTTMEGRVRRWSPNERLGGREQFGERLIDRLLNNPKLTTEIGLNEDQVARLREEGHEIEVRQMELESRIRKLALLQADHMSKLLLSPEVNTNEVMKGVEALGQLRTEQAKLTIQALLVVRKHLTPEQIRKARELMRDHMQTNAEARAEKKKEKSAPVAPPPPEGF